MADGSIVKHIEVVIVLYQLLDWLSLNRRLLEDYNSWLSVDFNATISQLCVCNYNKPC